VGIAGTELAAAAEMNVKTIRRQQWLLADLRIVTSLPKWVRRAEIDLSESNEASLSKPGRHAHHRVSARVWARVSSC
jgi:hypothetical protein